MNIHKCKITGLIGAVIFIGLILLSGPVRAQSMAVILDTPNGGESWEAGTSHNITWESSGAPDTFNLYYSIDNGASYTSIVPGLSGLSTSYSWPVPFPNSYQAKVKIEAVKAPEIVTAESAPFSIVDTTAPQVAVSQPPHGSDILTGGTTYQIRWTVNDGSDIKPNSLYIWYSTDSGASYPNLVTADANTQSPYVWTVPLLLTTEARVRVSVKDNSSNANSGTGESSGDFTIISDFLGPVITIDAPSGSGYIWRGGTVQPITFEATDPSGIKPSSLSVWYSTDNGATYTNQLNDQLTSSPYSWTLPSSISTTEVKVRLTLKDNSPSQNLGTGESAAEFTIDSTAPAVTVIQPNGGETLSGNNSTEVIKWTATDECGLAAVPITISYSTNSGASWLFITSEANSGSYTWTVPHLNTTTARVSVEAQNLVGLVGRDMSDNDFLITSDATGPTITVEAPVNGDVWRGGSTHLITFEASDPSEVKPNRYSIYYSTNAGGSYPNVITSEATLSSPYSWTVPTINSQWVRIRVTARDIYDNLGTGESTGVCTVDSTAPTVTSVAPSGGEKWRGGVNHNISWSASDIYNLKSNPITLQYSTNEGASWTTIETGVANSSSYSWPVPALNTNEARVKVLAEDAAGNVGSGASSADFIIDSTAPGTPEPLTQRTDSATNDSTPYFSWTAPTDNLSGISSYEITVDTIVATQAATTTNYTLPDALALSDGFHTWEVRAQDGAGNWGNYCTAESFQVITVAPAITGITLKDRTTGSTLYAKDRTVTLEASGVGGNAVKMVIAQDSAFTQNPTGWTTYANPTAFQLSSGDGPKTVYYKVRDAAMNESTFESAAITLDTSLPQVTALDPNGGENLGGGLNYTIRWTAADNVGLTAAPITIYFSHDSGATWDLVASHEANSGSYSWIVPNGIDSTACRISIEAVDLAGNVLDRQSTGDFNLISVGPATPVISAPANGGYVNTARPLLLWAAVPSAASYECIVDGTAVATAAANSYQIAYLLAEGDHTWEVRAKNAANLWGSASGGSFIVDVTGPALALDTFTDNANPQPAFHGRVRDNFKVVSAEARIDGGAWLAVTAVDGAFDSTDEAFVFNAPSLLARGTHTLEVLAYDAAGNPNLLKAELIFVITKSAVAFAVKMGGAAVTAGTIIPFRPTFSVSFTSPLPVVDFKVYIDTQSVYGHTGNFTSETVSISPFQDLAVGSHSLTITTQNIVGDAATKEVTGLTVISDVRVFMSAGAGAISLAVNTSSSGPATLILRRPNGQTILQKTIPDIGEAAQITIDKYLAGENLKGPYLWKIIYNSGRSSKSGGFIVP
jgi:hypothetical protein